MKFMNLMYSDKEIIDLLNYGIEGVNYTVLEDGTYGPVTDETVGVYRVSSEPYMAVWQSVSVRRMDGRRSGSAGTVQRN